MSGEPSAVSVDPGELARWRNRLLPAMLTFVGALTLFFMAVSVWETRDIQQRIAPVTSTPARAASANSIFPEPGAGVDGLAAAELRARIALEDRALELRYAHAVAVLASRGWVRFMGFVTGMVLALVGAIFILGRLETTPSTAAGEGGIWKASLATTSPGLVLAAFGTVLMLSAIVVKISVDVRDKALFMPPSTRGDPTRAQTPLPKIRIGAESMYLNLTRPAADTDTTERGAISESEGPDVSTP